MPGPLDVIELLKRHQALPPREANQPRLPGAASLPESGHTTNLGFFVSTKRSIATA